MKSFYKNEYLFSEIYLQEITQIQEDPAVRATLSTLTEYREYADTSSLEAWNESFVHEILNALRFRVRKMDGNPALLYQFGSDSTITLCYSLLPSKDLNSSTMGQNWSEKIIRSLRNNQLKWGILTNGDLWRVYHTEEPTPYENYLEIDLKGIMDAEDVGQYQIFNKFLKAENFVPDKDGNCQFDDFKKESQNRINYIEEELKNALKQKEEGGKGILSNICMGYVDYLRGKQNPDFSDEDLRATVYSSAMLYMFRLLFLFYAKARGLLEESNNELFSNVLQGAQKAQEQGEIGKDDYSLWNNLRELFSNIDLTYNGGLFNPAENEFVEEKGLSKTYLAPVIYYMTFYKDKAGNQLKISYRDMGVRHLGSLYEGLLEHKLFVADEDTEVRVTKNEVKFILASEGGKIVEGKYIPAGQVYFGTDKGMRKASGSYYTPEYIVDYIVHNTVGKKLEELRDEFSKRIKDTFDSMETAINDNEKAAFIELLKTNIEEFIQENVLKLSVLDPAMGSGHFLMNAINQISNLLTQFSNHFNILSDKDTSTTFWRRRVVENCIFGVDINPLAVELTKLSLWILSMAKDQPLSFLDHHLKCGNSLIGAKLTDIGHYPYMKEKRSKDISQFGLFENDQDFKGAVEDAVVKYHQIESSESSELGDIGDKKQWLDQINEVLKPYQTICDFHSSVYFQDGISQQEYDNRISSFPNTVLLEENSFFHWELEFPEVILNDNGFSVVIGNPPYIQIKQISWKDRRFFETFFRFAVGRFNVFYFFIEQAANILNQGGMASFIVPDRILLNTQCNDLRLWLLKKQRLLEIDSFSEAVFEDAVVDAVILFYKNEETNLADINVKNQVAVNGIKDAKYKEIPISYFLNSPSNQFDLDYDPIISNLINKIRNKSLELGQIGEIKDGIIQGKVEDKVFLKEPIDPDSRKLLFGKDITRYNISFNNNWVNYKPDELMKIEIQRREGKRPGLWMRTPVIFEREKILTRQTADEIIAALDKNDHYYTNTLHGTTIKDSKFDVHYVLGLLNCKLMTWYYRKTTAEGGKVFAQIKIFLLGKLPILNIDIDKQKSLADLAGKITSIKKLDPDSDTSSFEARVDRLVYELYDLNEEEVEIIEGES